ncbi:MAG: hypothetical protein HF976_09810 [ANME-2 cluster archaeon]|nr:hypothetical protein [ANME-2 cluster archaeon]MBC2701688.1 hypothetical protein [ANME-2 cluster archaeon]MBC2709187.1 hypothetical protein [ANME-2 cluster archaeon]MBC2745940.1 hypothetical protein [ANME-2 cluster archaeon]MBC2762987.1 hypothetical protein [ANME-2 cluster archaeon]
MISKMEYLKKRYKEMSQAQLELIIVQLDRELEDNPDSVKDELCIAVDALENKKKKAHGKRRHRPCLPGNFEHQLDVGEEF